MTALENLIRIQYIKYSGFFNDQHRTDEIRLNKKLSQTMPAQNLDRNVSYAEYCNFIF